MNTEGIATDFLDKLPVYISYIVVGYVFIRVYYWVAFRKPLDNIEHLIIQSGVIGYIYFLVGDLIPIFRNKYLCTAVLMLIALLTAYAAGKAINSSCVIKLLEKLHVYDTGNFYMWQDLLDKKYSMRAAISYDDKIYSGRIHLIENYNNTPNIVLCLYTIRNKEGKILEDFSEDYTKLIVLDTSKAVSTEIKYSYKSKISEDVKQFLEINSKN
mgnify:CR=1 FL=1